MKGKGEKNGEKKLEKSYFDVMGLCCSSEVKLVERILQTLEGVNDVHVSLPTKTVVVQHDPLLLSDFQIVKALNQAKLEASVRVKGSTDHKNKWPSPYAIGSGVLLCLSFLKYVYGPFGWLALGAVAIGIVPIVFRAFMAIRNLALGDTNILVVIAVAGSIALNDYWEAGTIVFLFAVAEWLESRASHKATAAMSSLVNLVPQRAVLAETGQEVEVGEVEVNTLLAVKEGEMIPIDGIVTEGCCEIDERNLSGESFPVSKQKDSNVWAGTLNVNGYVVIQTKALAEDSAVARMTKLVEEAQSNKSRTERYIEKCTKYYTPAIVVISLCLVVVPVSLQLHDLRHWYHLGLVILVSACPCALVLSTPVVMFCALVKAATTGVFFKGAQYVEILAKVRIIGFDKTGTITRGEFEVTEFQPLVDDISLTTLLYWVSSIERKSSHPLAVAMVDYAESHSVQPKPQNVEGFQNFPGEGIYGEIDGEGVYIGNKKIANRAACKSVPKLDGKIGEGKSVGYIFLGPRPAGIFYLSDICRTGAKEALKELKSMGIKTAMLTGDCQSAANQVQNQLGGFPELVHAELLPADKARIIKEFQEKSFTAMIGDGINDAPAIATADIGISMGVSGSALSIETGNIILMTNDIQRIPKVIHLARRVKRKIFENIFLSITTKGAIVGLAIAGHPLVWAAVLADVGTCLLVILNSMLLLGSMPRRGTQSSSCSSHAKKCCGSSACSGGKDNGSTCTEKPHHHHQISCDDKRPSHGCDSQGKKCCKSSATSGGIDQNSSCAEQLHLHQTCCNDNRPQNGCDSKGKKCCKSSACSQENKIKNHCTEEPRNHQTCCNEKKPLNGCDSQGKKCCKASACSQGYDQKIFSTEQPSHHQTHCIDKKPLTGCDFQMKKSHTSSACSPRNDPKDLCTEQPHHHQTCCSRAQNGHDAHACSSKDCSHAPQPNLSSCCSSETEKTNDCCIGKQNQHGKEENHIHDTKSLDHETCSIITQEPGLTSENHRETCSSIAGADTEDQCSHHGSHKSGSQMDNCTSCAASIPLQVLREQAETNPACLHRPKVKCGIHDADTTLGNNIASSHGHGSCGSVKSGGNPDKWHVGACCDSFRRECCAKGGHFHGNHIGGLSEIVIE